jgi:hypothetical protein
MNFALNSDPPADGGYHRARSVQTTGSTANPELRALRRRLPRNRKNSCLKVGLLRACWREDHRIGEPRRRAVARHRHVQISPSIGTESDLLTPTARLILGKRLSNRAFITFARALGAQQRDQSIVLEYDQTDRLGWVFTQNGDRTFAIDFRVRRTF